MATNQAVSHAVVFPSPWMSHIIQLIEFAKRLVSQHNNFHVTCIIPGNGPPSQATKAIVEALPTSIDAIFLPPVSFDDLADVPTPGLKIVATVARSLPSLRNVLESLLSKTQLCAFVTNILGSDSLDVAQEFNIPTYIFAAATYLSLLSILPELDQTVACEFKDLPEPVQILGWMPIHAKDLPTPLHDRKSDMYKKFLHIGRWVSSLDGIVINGFTAMESGAIKALQQGNKRPPLYPIGPIVQAGESGEKGGSESDCLRWLDNQPRGSVLYVSFGSGGSPSRAQLGEMALGLEMSGHRFLWVIRRPNDEIPSSASLDGQSQFDPSEVLPSGFMERTKGQGLLVPSWAPQAQILNHGATGGFLTHSGWNSTLERVAYGVPIIGMPLFAEQSLNAVMLVEDVKVALRLKANENGLVGREEIAKVAKKLLEGEKGKRVGQRMRDLKDAATRALREDGSSTKALGELAAKWANVKASKVD